MKKVEGTDELLTRDDLSPYAGFPNFLASFFLEFGSEIVALVPQHFPLFSFLETWLKYRGNLSRECRELSWTIMPCIKRLEQCVAKIAQCCKWFKIQIVDIRGAFDLGGPTGDGNYRN